MAERSVEGFQFEPKSKGNKRTGYDGYDDESSSDEEVCEKMRMNLRLDEWCKCGNCEKMPTEREHVCCFDLEAANYFNLGTAKDKLECITNHKNFVSIILLKGSLWTALVAMHDRESSLLPDRDNVPSKTYRYAAYRQFTWWVHTRLGRSVRRVIPSCAVALIREWYPAPDKVYTGFLDGKFIEEHRLAWSQNADLNDSDNE